MESDERRSEQEKGSQFNEPLIVDSGRMARFVTMAASKAGPLLIGLCLLLALVALMKWPDASSSTGHSSLLERYSRQRLLADLARHVESGDADGAASLWQAMLSREHNNITALRSFFDHDARLGGALVEKTPNREALVGLLMTLGGTNSDDMNRVLRLRARRLEWDRVVEVGAQMSTNLTAESKGLLAVAHLARGDVLAFDQQWSESRASLESDPSMKPWRLAANALLRGAAEAAEAKSDLTAMLAAGKSSPEVMESLLFLASQAGDIKGHRALIEMRRLKDRRGLKHWMDHVDLLARFDNARGIEDILDGLPLDRADPEDVEDVARRLMQLGLAQPVLRLVDRRQRSEQPLGNFTAMAGFASLVNEDWERCNNLAIGIQKLPSAPESLTELSHFLRGCAALGLGNEVEASASFDRMVVEACKEPASLLKMLSEGMRLGVGSLNSLSLRQAWLVTRDLEGSLGDDGAYWRTRSEMAGYASQVSDMVFAAKTAMQADAGSAASVAAMTRALLLAPDANPEVLSLSASLMKETPVLADWRILRASALVSYDRLAEGKAMLHTLKAPAIPATLLPSLNLAWLEAHVASQDWDAARKTLDGIRSVRWEPLLQAKVERLAAKIPKA